ncbi:hypothetical protein NE237_032576 [Protea cynaroides]|uniref:Uncharacterized protein n=1 Tax=Protea cynaroides TaxID=273540 RepID=A0A9Q0L3M1_9MAGN|nr:hypothetical protein NE237_032576 [Protea cynaroides]
MGRNLGFPSTEPSLFNTGIDAGQEPVKRTGEVSRRKVSVLGVSVPINCCGEQVAGSVVAVGLRLGASGIYQVKTCGGSDISPMLSHVTLGLQKFAGTNCWKIKWFAGWCIQVFDGEWRGRIVITWGRTSGFYRLSAAGVSGEFQEQIVPPFLRLTEGGSHRGSRCEFNNAAPSSIELGEKPGNGVGMDPDLEPKDRDGGGARC